MLRDDFTIYGVNEVQYSDLPADDMLTWYDQWNLAQFVVCMVTPNDPVLKEYAAAITKRMGGTPGRSDAGSGPGRRVDEGDVRLHARDGNALCQR